jgi:hypothetical protein
MHTKDCDPRAVILSDLRLFILKQQALGDIIIVGIDANEDVRGRTIKQFFNDLQMHDAILTLHSTNCPSTNLANESSEPIDAIFCSRSIIPSQAGFLGSTEGCPSDHVQLWADFDKNDLIGGQTNEFHLHVDPLNTRDPRLVDAYNLRSFSKLQESSVLQQLEVLDKLDPSLFSEEHITQYNEISQFNTTVRLEVKSKLRHVYTGKQAWSPEWAQSKLVQQLWLQVLRYRLLQQGKLMGRNGRPRQKVSLTQIRRLMRAADCRDALTFSVPEIESKLAAAKTQHKEDAKNCAQLRWSHVGKLDEARATQNETSVAAERSKRRHTERQREQGRALARLKNKTRQPVTKVTAKIAGITTECTTKESIELACLTENDRRFRQTEETPPMHPALTDVIGFSAEMPAANDILAGTFDTSDIPDKAMRKVIEYLRMPDSVVKAGPIDPQISVEEHIAGWNAQKERTASVRTALSFSDHKAAAQHPGLAKIDTLLRRIPYRNGFAPALYKFITDFQILKKSGIYDVELMRTIQLMVAAFNMNNKKSGRDTMRRAERLLLLPKEQAGSRKFRRSVLSALEKVFCNDIIRQRRLAAIILSNDAKSCYDRIVLWLAALALRRVGLHIGPTLEMMFTLQHAVHTVNTAFGDSTDTYGGSNLPPHQGAGQGNGAGPTIWAVISAILLTIMRNLGFGLNAVSSLSAVALSLVGFAFVDDTDLVNVAPSVFTKGEDHLHHSQQCVDWWVSLLAATGGGLRVDKSFWVFLDFHFSNGGWQYRSAQQLPGQLFATHFDGQRMCLRRLEPSQGEVTLGVSIAMDGNNRDEKEYLLDKAMEYADQLRSGVIAKKNAWYSFTNSFMKTIEYPMEAVSFSEEDWDEILQPVMGILLQRSGIASTFPRKLVWTAAKYQGLGAQHPFYLMLFKQLSVVLIEPQHGSHAGDQLVFSAEELRRETGFPGHFADIPVAVLSSDAITNCWMKSLLLRLQNLGVRLEDHLPKLSPRREGDLFLVEFFLLANPSAFILRDLLHCCQFLRVHTLADLATADGKALRPSTWSGKRVDRHSHNDSFPRPPPWRALNWRRWQEALAPLVISARNLSLRSPLGLWLSPPSSWHYHYSPSQDRIFVRKGLLWHTLRRSAARPNRRLHQGVFAIVQDPSPTLPKDLLRADVSVRRARFLLHSVGAHLLVPSRPPPTTLDDASKALPRLDQWAIDECWHSDNGLHLATALRHGTALAISDGSYKQDRGTSAFLLQGPLKAQFRILGVNRTPGAPADQSAYRAELSGISGILALLSLLCQIHQIHKGSIRIGLDGDSAMKEASGFHPLSAEQPSFDLLADIRNKICQLPLTISFFWVEGHQYERHGFVSYLGTLNDICDSMAKQHWNDSIPLGILPPQRFGTEKFSVMIADKKLAQINKADFYDASHGLSAAIPYWAKRHHLSDVAIQDINWDAIKLAMAEWPFGKRRWLAKHLAGFSATGRVMLRRKEWSHDLCPRCEAPNEDAFHVQACRHPTARLHFRQAVDTAMLDLDSIGTAPDIVLLIKSRLLSWGSPSSRNFTYYPCSPEVRRALQAQDSLGWYQALNGRLSTAWQDAQAMWIARQATRYKRSPTKWAGRAVLALLEISWQMWEHRNHIYHDPSHPWSLQRCQDTNHQIQLTLGAHEENAVLPKDRHLFSIPPEELTLHFSEADKLKWIASVTAAYSRFHHHQAAANSRDPLQTSLASWLYPHPV